MEKKEAQALVGQRCLIFYVNVNRYNAPGGPYPVEVQIMEISTTGEWTKLKNVGGSTFWRKTKEFERAEVLSDEPTGTLININADGADAEIECHFCHLDGICPECERELRTA